MAGFLSGLEHLVNVCKMTKPDGMTVWAECNGPYCHWTSEPYIVGPNLSLDDAEMNAEFDGEVHSAAAEGRD